MRPYNRYSSAGLTTDAQIVRPYNGLHVSLYYNGRTTVRPYNRYSSAGLTTDALRLNTPVRPYNGLHVSLYYNGRTDRASLQGDVSL